MAKLSIGRRFLQRYAKLDHATQKRVDALAEKCRTLSIAELSTAKGSNLEPYVNQRDPRARTVRLGDNHRGIVMIDETSELLLLVDVLLHDDADRWMLNNEFRVNEATGALEVVDTPAIRSAIESTSAGTSEPDQALFSHRGDKEFTSLGIDGDLLPLLRRLQTDNELEGLLAILPQGQAEALIGLTGDDSTETIYAAVVGSPPSAKVSIDTTDVAAAAVAPASRHDFREVVDDQDLAEMLAKPLALWRTFLHPSQHEAAYRPVYNGPVRITGGPGTGKTVVAVHRAKALAEAGEGPILFTTFTRNLATAIQRDLTALGGDQLAQSVEVLNVDRLAHRVVADAEGKPPGIVSNDVLKALWAEVVEAHGYELTPTFLHQEWEQVVIAQDLQSRDAYFAASRAGRGTRLDRRDRAKVWKVIEAVTAELSQRNQRTYLQVAARAAGYARKDPTKPYRHVIVDEGQDLHEAQLRLLRAVVAEQPNDIFIVGDSHQRIYDRRSSLGRVGIKIQGRSRRLRINYRTTHEILRWALALLGEASFDDMDEGVDNHDVAGYHSYMHGPVPTTAGFRSRGEMARALADEVERWVAAGVDPTEIAVAGRTQYSFKAIEEELHRRKFQTSRLGRELKPGPGVALGTMHRLKGLEYRNVAVVDVDDSTVPHHRSLTSSADDPVQHANDLRAEQCLLYVACTRARDELWVGWTGKPSRYLAIDD